MKKFILMMVFALMTVLSVNAQTAIETPKLTDNMYIGIGGGVTTPLDFNSVFPLNSGVKVVVGKNITPILGFEVEGLAMLNDNHFADMKTLVKATNVGLNGTINLSNLFAGYKGKPRWFEFRTNTGLGWMHTFDVTGNYLTAKTALDIVWNIGKPRAIALTVSPGVYWNLNSTDGAIRNIKFNKHNAQFAVMATLTYNFKNKNGVRYFKMYDVGAMIGEIDRLNEELAKKPTEVIVEKVVPADAPATNAVEVKEQETVTVFFAQGSAELTDQATETLKDVDTSFTYDIYGFASPEGTKKFNDKLSQDRADAVAKFLQDRGAKVNVVKGEGVKFGPATNRVVIVTTAK